VSQLVTAWIHVEARGPGVAALDQGAAVGYCVGRRQAAWDGEPGHRNAGRRWWGCRGRSRHGRNGGGQRDGRVVGDAGLLYGVGRVGRRHGYVGHGQGSPKAGSAFNNDFNNRKRV